MPIALPQEVLELLKEGISASAISQATCWPTRRIFLLGSQHGYLFTADGVPYKPPETLAQR